MSRSLGNERPLRPHLLRAGVGREVGDLREDVERGFSSLEDEVDAIVLSGIPGPEGPVGPQGPAGPAGAIGPQGPAGPAGPTGSKGDIGNTGPAGPIGPDGPQGVAGPQGDPGAQGPAGSVGATGSAGSDGKTVRSGSGAPSGGLGVDGDFYINTAASTIYGPKTSGAWGSPTNIIGPQGATGVAGAAGASGADGRTVHSGAGTPSAGLGIDGDFYINTLVSTLYGPKISGSWGSPTSLIGPQGATGATGLQGATGATGPSTGTQVVFGANALGTTGTRYLMPSYTANVASTGVKRLRITKNCTAVRMDITNSAAGTGTGDYTFTLATVVSDVATTTTLTVNLLATARSGSVTASVSLTAGQEIAIQTVANGTITASPVDTFATIGLDP
jgi:hypothetical protein